MKFYTSDHEWLEVDGDLAVVGITRHASQALGDLVFLDPKPVGSKLKAGTIAAVVESVKAASEIYAPVDGEVVEINQPAVDEPSIISAEPEAAGWMFKLKLSDPEQISKLLDKAGYARPSLGRSDMANHIPEAAPFARRHIGPSESEAALMLHTMGFDSIEGLIAQTLPSGIRDALPMGLGKRCPSRR